MTPSLRHRPARPPLPSGAFRPRRRHRTAGLLLGAALLAAAGLVPSQSVAEATPELRPRKPVRMHKLGLPPVAGLAYSPAADLIIVFPVPQAEGGGRPGTGTLLDRFREPVGTITLPIPLPDPRGVAYDAYGGRLLALDMAARSLHAIPMDATGGVDAAAALRLETPRVGPLRPAGMAVDPATGEVFILDRLSRAILRFMPVEGAIPEGRWIKLGPLAPTDLDGLAFDPVRRHLFTLDAAGRAVYQITDEGYVAARYDVPELRIADPQSLVFAPSADQTDDPATLSLYLADPLGPGSRQGHVLELAWRRPPAEGSEVAAIEAATAATLVRVTQTSAYSPPSTDPTGITYDSVNGRLTISDAEVEELSFWAGKNVWETTLAGSVLRSYSVTSFTIEPTDVAFDPVNRQLYISDDDADKVFVLSPGGDNVFGTGDDQVRSFTTRTFNSTDAEGIAFDRVNRRLLIADGVNEEIYILRPGPNGIFDGVPPTGDDLVSQFDTSVLGVTDPEAVEYRDDAGTVFLVKSTGVSVVREVTITGSPVSDIDVSSASISRASSLAYGPTSNNPGGRSLYMLDARSWHSNDGRLVEMSVAGSVPPPSNTAPTVSAGPDQTVTLPASASLDGTVTDDGLPNPPGAVTTTWSRTSGPGTVTFANANAVDTQASFSTSGTYVLRLTANDGALSAWDEVQVTVQPEGSSISVDRRVAANSDDAEEAAGGAVDLNSSDLELVFSGSNQTVGMRFANLTIPKGVTINTAYVQFAADEAQSEATNLTIQAEASDNATTFSTTSGNVSTRPRTGVSVSWSPPAWNTIGEEGPAQRTPELKSLIQAVVNRSGWASGNALAVIITGTGHRTAESYNGSPTQAPLLHVEYGGTPPSNTAPSVSAGPDQTITLPASASLDGTVSDDGLPNPPGAVTTTWSRTSGPGTVTFANANAVDTQASFSVAGTYVLRLTANDGALSAWDEVQITVQAQASNTAPVVSAGPDQTVVLPASASLDGTVSDDGLPSPPGAVTTTWSRTSGPGTVTFANANAVDTQASFSTSGTYVLRLTANDGALSAWDEVQVTVQPEGSSISLERRIAAGSDDAEESAGGNVSLNSSDIELVFSSNNNQTIGLRFINLTIPQGASITNAYIQFTADERQSEVTNLLIQAQAADNAATFSSSANVSGRPRTAASASWSPNPWNTVGEAGPDQRTPDLRSLIQEVVSRGGWASGNALAIIITGTGHRTAESYNGSAATAALLHVEYGGGPVGNVAPSVSAGPDQAILLPAPATLDGTVGDDGLPDPPGAVTTTWSQVSGPGSVTFADATAVDTQASFSTAGTYVLRLTADDGELSAWDEAAITANPAGLISRRIASGDDDMEEQANGHVSHNSSDLELVYDRSAQTVGLRFPSLPIPPGATIESATIQFKTDEAKSEPTSLVIQAHASGDAPPLTRTNSDISSRPRTAASVTWSPAPWGVVGEAGPDQQTPDLSPVFQEIADRPDWASGNAVVVIITGTGRRNAESFEGDPSGAALLELQVAGPGPEEVAAEDPQVP